MKTKMWMTLIIMILLITINCRSKIKAIETLKDHKAETFKINSTKVEEQKDQIIEQKKEVLKVDKKEEEVSGSTKIKGATTPENDFNYYNVVSGDTLQKIYIKGSADFTIENSYKKSDVKKEEIKVVDNLNLIGKIARKAVATETIKDVAIDIKKSNTTIKNKGFQMPVYGIFLIGGIAVFFIWFIWRKFGSGITSVITNARKRFGTSKTEDK